MIPMFASEKRAAELLDMSKALFRQLVDDGLLPRHVAIGNEKRWDVEALRRAVRGEASPEPEPEW